MLLLHTASSRGWRFGETIPTRAPGRPTARESLFIALPWRPSWRRQPSCWQSPFGYYRWWAAGRVCSVRDLTHSSGRDAALPRNALSGVECVAFSVAVSMQCRVPVRISPPPFSSGFGTGNGGVIYRNTNADAVSVDWPSLVFIVNWTMFPGVCFYTMYFFYGDGLGWGGGMS